MGDMGLVCGICCVSDGNGVNWNDIVKHHTSRWNIDGSKRNTRGLLNLPSTFYFRDLTPEKNKPTPTHGPLPKLKPRDRRKPTRPSKSSSSSAYSPPSASPHSAHVPPSYRSRGRYTGAPPASYVSGRSVPRRRCNRLLCVGRALCRL